MSDQTDQRQHLYAATTEQRDTVVNSFHDQRTALRKAVDDQRRAALAPIHATNARRRGGGAMPAQQMAELIVLLRQLVADEVKRELDRREMQVT